MPSIHFQDFLHEYASQHNTPDNLVSVLQTVAQCCLDIKSQARAGALADLLGAAGVTNVQGEEQKKLDILANDILIDGLRKNSFVAGLASEEEEEFVPTNQNGEYLVLFDPLDGSSNIEINMAIGTIFSVLPKPAGPLTTESFLQTGKKQVAAGYCLYGPQTILTVSLGDGVFTFTLDEKQNEFVLTAENIQIPEQTHEFAINMSNQRFWQPPVQQYIAQLLAGKDSVRGKNYNMRWIASMVAEVHRILTRSGIFMYPKDNREPDKPGKLRLMYEANPMSFLIVAAGGQATNGIQDILSIKPQQLHQRVAVFLGSKEEVEYVTELHQK